MLPNIVRMRGARLSSSEPDTVPPPVGRGPPLRRPRPGHTIAGTGRGRCGPRPHPKPLATRRGNGEYSGEGTGPDVSGDQPLRILLAAPEVLGFAKTGGLADVAGALPRALARRGHTCAVMMPLYRGARLGRVPVAPTGHTFTIHVGGRGIDGSLWEARLPGCDVPVYLVGQPAFFERDDPAQGHGLYQFTLPNGQKRDYSDNCERFTFFSRAVLEAIRLLDFWPDVLHLNDWQTGLLAPLLKEEYAHHWAAELQPRYAAIRALCTVHNIAYQGLFPYHQFLATGLGHHLFNYRQLEFYGQLSLLKAGFVFSDAINTVSPTYAREIQTAEFGCGLQGVLSEQRDRLFGIVN